MLTYQTIKQELQIKLEQLPASKLQEVLDFASFLLFQQQRHSINRPISGTATPEPNLLTDFIGGVSHGSLAQDIDEEVYGA